MADISAHDNQAGLDLVNPPSTRGTDAVKVFHVPLIRATATNLRGLGRPVKDFATETVDITPFPTSGWRKLVPGTGDQGGVVEDVFRNQRIGSVQYSVNVGLQRKYVLGWYGDDPLQAAHSAPDALPSMSSILTHEANYHPDGGQIICSRGGAAIVLLLAPPGDDVTPASFRAFLVDPSFDGTTGVHIDAGTWHQPAFPAHGGGGGEAGVLDNRQGRVHACVSVSFVHEFGGYLRVPLNHAAVLKDDAACALPRPVSQAPRLGYTILYVRDVPRAMTFYAAAFGLRHGFTVPDDSYGQLQTGATALSFASVPLAASNLPRPQGDSDEPAFKVQSRAAQPPAFEVGLVVPDVATALARALEAGAQLVAPLRNKPWGQQVAYVRDEDGFLVELCSPMG